MEGHYQLHAERQDYRQRTRTLASTHNLCGPPENVLSVLDKQILGDYALINPRNWKWKVGISDQTSGSGIMDLSPPVTVNLIDAPLPRDPDNACFIEPAP